HVESSQTKIGLTIVGFATGFELVVLACRAAKHGASEAVGAAAVGSFSFKGAMTFRAAAVVAPPRLWGTPSIHLPVPCMLFSLAIVILLAARKSQLRREEGLALLGFYPVFVASVLWK